VHTLLNGIVLATSVNTGHVINMETLSCIVKPVNLIMELKPKSYLTGIAMLNIQVPLVLWESMVC
jgi:hypothetical protein